MLFVKFNTHLSYIIDKISSEFVFIESFNKTKCNSIFDEVSKGEHTLFALFVI